MTAYPGGRHADERLARCGRLTTTTEGDVRRLHLFVYGWECELWRHARLYHPTPDAARRAAHNSLRGLVAAGVNGVIGSVLRAKGVG